jgi:spore coat polysaccharide biosynthesis predicted glycosyltransferase SpsG
LAAGSTTWEALRCGVAPIVVAVADNQRAVAAGVEALGAGVSLGWHGDADADASAARVVGLLEDPEALDALTRHCRGVVDGRGVLRAIDALLDAIDRRGQAS